MLKYGAIPSVFAFNKASHSSPTPSPREKRMKARAVSTTSKPDVQLFSDDISHEEEVVEEAEVQELQEQEQSSQSQEVQCNIGGIGKFSIQNFVNNAQMVSYYTGFAD